MGNQTKRKWNHHNSRLLELCQLPQVQETELQQELPNERHNPLSDLPPPCGFGRFIDINPSWTNDGITSSIGSTTNGRAALNDCLHGPKQVTTRRIGECIKWGKSPAISLVWKTRSTSITSTPRGMMRRREKRRGYKKKRL